MNKQEFLADRGVCPSCLTECCPAARLANRMHAFEASLFMVGYDVTGLDCIH